jgi:L-lactate dehydrogenase complex protein LldE
MMRRRGYRPRFPTQRRVKAALCATCLVDQFYPEVGTATVSVLRRLGVDLSFPEGQTCCGQIAFNGGYRRDAAGLARAFVEMFEDAENVVIPSGSCATMVKVFYPDLFADDPEMLPRVEALSSRVHEFSEFIVNVLGVKNIGAKATGRVTYHDACHLLRELGVSGEPRSLIQGTGVDFVEMENSDTCCGFGGLFAVKYPDISMAILGEKLKNIEATRARTVIANDCGCLMHIGGAMGRDGMKIKPVHIAEFLAGEMGNGSD